MHKNRMFNWKTWGIAVLLLMPMTFAPSRTRAAKADTMAATSAPTLVSGTVKQYFTNRAGYVSALSLETPSGIQMVHFAPSWAKRLLANNPTGATFDGWVKTHREGEWSWNDLVSIGKDPVARVLDEKMAIAAQQPVDTSWQWKKSKPGKVQGKLKKIIVNGKGDVLGLVLDTGALIKVPLTVRNEELGAHGTDAIAPLFKDVEVSAWGSPEWQASGDVSIYNQHLAASGLSINGKTVSAIGIPRLPINKTSLLKGYTAAEIVGADGEYAPFNPSMAMTPSRSTYTGSPRGAHIGHGMLQATDGKFYQVIHRGIQIFAVVRKNALEFPLVNGAYVPPVSLPGSKLVMVMDDGRQFEMSSSDGKLYVDLPDGNKSPVKL